MTLCGGQAPTEGDIKKGKGERRKEEEEDSLNE